MVNRQIKPNNSLRGYKSIKYKIGAHLKFFFEKVHRVAPHPVRLGGCALALVWIRTPGSGLGSILMRIQKMSKFGSSRPPLMWIRIWPGSAPMPLLKRTGTGTVRWLWLIEIFLKIRSNHFLGFNYS